jgi:murein DD-endopeptidase MepM/ murein hydrolase activator NlpD
MVASAIRMKQARYTLLRRTLLSTFILLAAIFILAPFASAQVIHTCGTGISLRLTSQNAAQGSLLELTLVSHSPLQNLKGMWAGNPLPFWSAGEHTQHALLGVDLERAPGKYDLAISADAVNGGPVKCQAAISVREGHFAVENLHVAGAYVDLSPEDSSRAEKESAHLHEIFAQVSPERLWQGAFRMPLVGVHSGHNFGRRRVLNGEARSPHTGLDMPAAAGTPIHAPQRGRVVLAENLFFSGNTVVLDHGLGVYTFYGHMQSIAVSVGDVVNPGAVIGRVGSTGRATGPHLHWSLIVDGARVNPLQIVSLGVR